MMLRFGFLWFILVALLGCAAATERAPPELTDLAPTGTLRAAINFGNPILATRDAATGEARGVSVDLSRSLAARLWCPSNWCCSSRPARWSKPRAPGSGMWPTLRSTRPARGTCCKRRLT